MDRRIMAVAAAIVAIALASSPSSSPFAGASDPNNLQDFCVAIDGSKANVFVNGKTCKNPTEVTADDFFLEARLVTPRNTSNSLGSTVTPVTVEQLPGLNALGVSIGRVDFAPNGVSPPHTHPHAAEVIAVADGVLYAGFVDSKSKLFAKTLNPGDVFVVPKGLVHFLFNVGGSRTAVAFSGHGSQNPGGITVANSVFAADPPIFPELLAKAFQLDSGVINNLQSQIWYEPSK
ncbi:unnamed protein product [Cuscuta campestris]|uniref:Germin-like protein n=1 Tax=Cuscuta campestris TaxID=132261 RepID=A0A484MCN3_9ASTE|nr:unnamed protein product [Cuscuta campestris]